MADAKPTTSIRVDILISLYNGIEFLREAIDSIKSQTYTNWHINIGINGHGAQGPRIKDCVDEIVISLLGSNENTTVILQNDSINNKSKSLNDLVSRLPVETDWICLLDADDIWLPRKLEAQIDVVLRHDDIDVVGTHCTYFGEARGHPKLPTDFLPRKNTLEYNPIINSRCFLSKKYAGWNESDYIQGIEDYDLWLRLDFAGRRMYNVPEHLVLHRIYRESAFNSKGLSADSLVKLYRDLAW